ncbi:MAG: protease modulator HflC [Chloroflexi bacterium]|nr:protease modulator HflC [Chloroflexota bacterium]
MKVFLAVAVLVFAALILVPQVAFTVDETKQAIVLQFGEPIRVITKSGLHFKTPFLQQRVMLEKRILISDPPTGEYFDADKKRLLVDHLTRWRISDPLRFYQTVRDEIGGEGRIRPVIFSELRDELARHFMGEAISQKREPIMQAMGERVRPKVANFGIDIMDVRLKRVDLPREVQASVFARMEAERQRIGKGYRADGEELAAKIRAEAERERTVLLADAYEKSESLRGEGDAEASRVYADAFQQDMEFYQFLRSLEAYERFLSQNTSVVLSSDSELFRYLMSIQKPPSP